MRGLSLAVVDNSPALHVFGDEGAGIRAAWLWHSVHRGTLDNGRVTRMPRGRMSENEMDEAAADAEKRAFAADQRDDTAAERDAVADIRDDIADEREHRADDRESELDGRERQLDSRGQALGAAPLNTPKEASSETLERANAGTLREAAHQQHEDRGFEQHAEDAARENVKKERQRHE